MDRDVPCDAAFELVDALVAWRRTVDDPPAVAAGSRAQDVDERPEQRAWDRLGDLRGDRFGVAMLGRRAVEALAQERDDPFAGFLEADEPIIEQYQWFKHTERDALAVRLVAARCLALAIPGLCVG